MQNDGVALDFFYSGIYAMELL